MNYPALLALPRSLRTGLPASASERAGNGPTAVPDSTGVVPRWVVRSVPLRPTRHSATTVIARFLSRLNNAGRVASIVLPPFSRRGSNTAGCESVKNFAAPGWRISSRSYSRQYKPVEAHGNNRRRRRIPTLLRSLRSLRGGWGRSGCISAK